MELNQEPKSIVVKRIMFMGVILIVFLICYFVMANKFDPLARYQYVTRDNRHVILEYMDSEDIDYIISQKIKPEQFMDFIKMDNFKAKNILYYDIARKTQNSDAQYIVNFINTYRDKMNLDNEPDYLTNYTYGDLASFWNGGYSYIVNAELVSDPSVMNLIIPDKASLYRYVPKNLVQITNEIVPYASVIDGQDAIMLKEEVVSPLKQMVAALATSNKQTGGGLILTSGYIAYDDQVNIYDSALIANGADKVLKISDYPGHSEQQLGYTLTFTVADSASAATSSQATWLKDNAYKYGFIIRYPEGKENITGKNYQALTLRYVGKDIATQMHKSGKTFDETMKED